jgi:hypothetical protein
LDKFVRVDKGVLEELAEVMAKKILELKEQKK